MHFYFFTLIIISLQCSLLWADECTKLLGHLGSAQKDFVYCATTKAVPVHLCIGCQPQLDDMVTSYGALQSNELCDKKFFDHDRINIISTTQSILMGLWTRAFCDDCFNGNHSEIFDEKSSELDACLKKNADSPCTACLLDYEDLNNFYTSLDQHNNAKVCFDIQDKMNITRSHWSKDLKCCKRVFNMIPFLIVSILMSVLPIVFYISLYVYGKRRENIHDVLNNEDTETTSSRVPNLPPSALPVQSESATTSNNTRNNFRSRDRLQNKKVITDIESEESDEDLLKKR